MNPSEYRIAARRTRNGDITPYDQMVNATMGLADEAGEVVGFFKKVLFHNHDFDVDKIKKELGDVMWYLDWIADQCGLTLEEIMQGNIDKLLARYPDGFDPERSKNRQEEWDGH